MTGRAGLVAGAAPASTTGPLGPAGRRVAGLLAVAVGAALVGLVLAAAASSTTPLLLPLAPGAVLALLLAYRTPLRGVAVVLLLSYVALRPLAGPLQVGQALQVVAVGGLVVRRLVRGRTPLPVPRELLWGGALLAVALLSTGRTVDLELTVKQDVALAVGLAFAAAVAAVAQDRARWLLLVRCLVLGGAVVCVPALLAGQQVQARYGGALVSDRPQGIFAQPNELGVFAMLVALVSLGLLLGAEDRRDRWLGLLTLLPAVGAMLLSLSRGSWIGFSAGVVALLVVVPRARRLLATAALAVVVLAAGLGAFAPDAPQVTVVTDRLASLAGGEQNPYDDRPRIWAEAFREIGERPLLGQGPGTFPAASQRAVSSARTVEAQHAHDVLLTVAAELGLLGLAALLGLTAAVGRRCWRALRVARARGDAVVVGVLGGTAASLVSLVGEGAVDFTLRNPLVFSTVWAVLGLAVGGAALVLPRR